MTRSRLKIQRIGDREQGVSFCPARGGLITGIQIAGRQILYMNWRSFHDLSRNVRGGIPVMFPNAGPITGSDYPELPQHGFARKCGDWDIAQENDSRVLMTLFGAEIPLKFWDSYPSLLFKLTLGARLEPEGGVTVFQGVENLSEDGRLPISMGLHPYHPVRHEQKQGIRFDFPGGKEIEARWKEWANGGTVSVPNPTCDGYLEPLRVYIPGLGWLLVTVSAIYQRLWVWSQKRRSFFCFEAAMRDENGLVENPGLVPPQTTYGGSIEYNLIPD